MTDKVRFPQLREQAIALRRAGKSRAEIKDILGIGSNETLGKALRGEPPPEWTLRARAKDDLHAKARELRARGHTYDEIAAELGVSKGSVSLWVRDLPRPARLSYAESRRRNAEATTAYFAARRIRREAERREAVDAAAAQIGPLSDHDILVAGSIAYWCEGAKSKPYRPYGRVTFVNSDPGLILFFLRFLAVAGVPTDRLAPRLLIHESADVAAAHRFWQDVTGLGPEQFRRATLKRHNPKTVRKNTGADYHGCLVIDVLRSEDLYRRIEGWATAAMGPPAKFTS
jgi:DNA-binding CsgD family transcriptional regulator